MSLDGPAMADGAGSVGFSGRHGFKRVNTTFVTKSVDMSIIREITEWVDEGSANEECTFYRIEEIK